MFRYTLFSSWQALRSAVVAASDRREAKIRGGLRAIGLKQDPRKARNTTLNRGLQRGVAIREEWTSAQSRRSKIPGKIPGLEGAAWVGAGAGSRGG